MLYFQSMPRKVDQFLYTKTSMNNLLQLNNITFSYPNSCNPTLNHLNFSFKPKERIGIIGPNGSGKTTFLHICVGLLSPQHGKILFKNQSLSPKSRLQELRRSIGLVFQNPEDQLFSPTVLEDLAFGPLNLGYSSQKAKQMALDTLKLVGLEGYEDRITHKLSGGEKKLLSIATILAMQPEALLLDEPTTGLDPETRDRLKELINTLDLGLVIVTHDLDFLDKTISVLYSLQAGQLLPKEKLILHRHLHSHPCGDIPHEHKNGDLYS